MTTVVYDIELLDPVVVTAPGGDPNSSATLRYLPGSQLRGMIIALWCRTHPGSPPGWFFDGTVRFLNGYRLAPPRPGGSPVRSLPTPASWQKRKQDKLDAGTTLTDAAWRDPDPKDTWVRAGNYFCVCQGADGRFPEVATQFTVHTQPDRVYGRSRQGSGALYRAESLLPEQSFQAAILCDDLSVAPKLLKLFGESVEASLGGSRTAGYGTVEVTAFEVDDWREAIEGSPPASEDLSENVDIEADFDDDVNREPDAVPAARFTITLLSDAIVRDDNGQTSRDPEVLAEAIVPGRKPQASFLDTGPVGGFNRHWGLPLPQEWAFSLGSVLVFDGQPPDLSQVLSEGIGERRAEGFGRLGLNVLVEPTVTVREPVGIDQNAPPPLDGTAKVVAQKMLERLREEDVERAVTAKANDLVKQLKGELPPKSQIHRLRAKIQAALRTGANATDVQCYLKRLERRSSTREAFTKMTLDGQRLDRWLHDLAADDEKPRVKLVPAERKLGGKGLDPPDAWRLNLELMDRVLARLAKVERQGGADE